MKLSIRKNIIIKMKNNKLTWIKIHKSNDNLYKILNTKTLSPIKKYPVIDINKEIPIALIGDWNTFNFVDLETNQFLYKSNDINYAENFINHLYNKMNNYLAYIRIDHTCYYLNLNGDLIKIIHPS